MWSVESLWFFCWYTWVLKYLMIPILSFQCWYHLQSQSTWRWSWVRIARGGWDATEVVAPPTSHHHLGRAQAGPPIAGFLTVYCIVYIFNSLIFGFCCQPNLTLFHVIYQKPMFNNMSLCCSFSATSFAGLVARRLPRKVSALPVRWVQLDILQIRQMNCNY